MVNHYLMLIDLICGIIQYYIKHKKAIKMEMLKKEALDSMESVFKNCYSCTRVWSAWSYDTMTIDDFTPFDKDDESFLECFDSLIDSINNTEFISKEVFYDAVIDIISDYDLYYNDDIDNNFSSGSFNNDVFEEINLDDMFISFREYKNFLLIGEKGDFTMSNNDKNSLISAVNQNSDLERFKSVAMEHLDGVRVGKERYVEKSVAVEDYLRNPSLDTVQKSIIKHSDDEYNLSYVIEVEAIKKIEERIASGDLSLSDVSILGECDNSIKNFMNAAINETSIGILNDIRAKARRDGISHVVDHPLDNIKRGIVNSNFALVSRIVHKDTVELINPSYDMLFKDIGLDIQKGRSDSLKSIQEAYNAGESPKVIKGLVEKSFAFERLNLLTDKMALFEADSVPLIKPMLEELRKDFNEGIESIIKNSKKSEINTKRNGKLQM